MPDNDGRTIAVIEMVEIRVARIGDVDLAYVVDEGEGDESIEQWRAGHTAFFESDEMRAAIGDHDFVVDDDTLVVLQRFRLVEPHQLDTLSSF